MSKALLQLSKEELAAKFEEALFENIRLKEELAKLKRLIFGQKSERFIPAEMHCLPGRK